MVLPSVEEVSTRKHSFSSKIPEAENSAQQCSVNIDSVRREIEQLEEKRRELQDELNEREMVLISAGSFKMGSDRAGRENDTPEHKVQVNAFYMDRYEVTNIQYKDFVDATGRRTPVQWQSGTFPSGKTDHPVVNVTWEDARSYAEWVNKRLPSEAEWEWAARGTSSVDKYTNGQSEFDIWDMCGNVGEWVNDWYDAKYYARSSESDPQGPPDGKQKVYRGGGFQTNPSISAPCQGILPCRICTKIILAFAAL